MKAASTVAASLPASPKLSEGGCEAHFAKCVQRVSQRGGYNEHEQE
jgi:hypothetical protein